MAALQRLRLVAAPGRTHAERHQAVGGLGGRWLHELQHYEAELP
jgi:hypothetical protein